MRFIVKLILIIALLQVIIIYSISLYEKLNAGEKLNFLSVLKVMLYEYFASVYIFFSWVFGFIPFEEWYPGRGKYKIPVFIIPGYFLTRTVILPLFLRFKRGGFENVYLLVLRPFSSSIKDLSEKLSVKVKQTLEMLGYERCIIVGHSVGGLVARYFIEKMGGDKITLKCITLGTPHKGTKTSVLLFGKNTKDMLPSSKLIEELNQQKKGNYFCILSKLDASIIPKDSAIITTSDYFEADSLGHFGMLFSEKVFLKIIEHIKNEKIF